MVKDIILKQYEQFGKSIVLLGHSKGGTDAAAACAMYWDELKDKLRGLVMLQAPYGGTPLAADLLRGGQFGALNALFLGKLATMTNPEVIMREIMWGITWTSLFSCSTCIICLFHYPVQFNSYSWLQKELFYFRLLTVTHSRLIISGNNGKSWGDYKRAHEIKNMIFIVQSRHLYHLFVFTVLYNSTLIPSFRRTCFRLLSAESSRSTFKVKKY